MSKLKGARLENEVEKCRAEQNWDRLAELLPAISAKGSGLEYIVDFLIGEASFERFLDGFLPGFPQPESAHRETLKVARKHFLSVVDSSDVKPVVMLESQLLLTKLYFVCAQFEDALSTISKAGLDKEETQFHTLRTLRLVAEAYAIRALCMEHSPQKFKTKGQRVKQVLANFEKSAELVMIYLQEMDKNSAVLSTTGSLPSAASSVTLQVPPPGSVMSTTSSTTNTSLSTMSAGATLARDGGRGFDRLGELMEMALQRVPIMHVKRNLDKLRSKGEDDSVSKDALLAEGVEIYRRLLFNVDRRASRAVQQTLARQLAEFLLRGLSEASFRWPDSGALQTSLQINKSSTNLTPGTPVNFYIGGSNQLTSGNHLFVPANKLEDALLLLMISDRIACREAVLTRAQEHEKSRELSIEHVTAVHNLLTLVLSGLRQYSLVAEMFERAMKFAYEDSHVWFQFALSLLCQARVGRAALVLEECLKMKPDDVMFKLYAAKLYIEHLARYEEGIRLTSSFREESLYNGGWLNGRASLLEGLGHSLLAQTMQFYPDRKWEESKAVDCFHRAVRCDPRDHLGWFFLALQYAIKRNNADAKECCQRALQLNADHAASVLLMALIMTSDKHYVEALELVESALDNTPNHFGLIVLRMKLELLFGRNEEALMSAKDLLVFWKRDSLCRSDQVRLAVPRGPGSPDGEQSAVGVMLLPRTEISTTQLPRAVSQPGLATTPLATIPSSTALDLADRESVSASVTGATMSEYGAAASTLSDSLGLTATSTGQRSQWQAWRMQANTWLELGELFLEAGRMEEMEHCVEEALASFPSSHQAFYLRGRAHQMNGRLRDAKQAFLAALGVFPSHIPSLRQLALVYRDENKLHMAEKTLREVVRIDPLDHKAWHALGAVLCDAGHAQESSECFETALILEECSPLMPYSVIPRVLHLN